MAAPGSSSSPGCESTRSSSSRSPADGKVEAADQEVSASFQGEESPAAGRSWRKELRRITVFSPDSNRKRKNGIRTNKYHWYSILPQILFEQFSQAPNAYFLVIMSLQLIPAISNTGGLPLTGIPLTFVVGVSALKDIYEDWRRKVSDRAENLRPTVSVRMDGTFTTVRWQDVRPGDLLRIENGEQIPVDGLLLGSSDGGDCFVQTMNLDGETNLKKKNAALTQDEWAQTQKSWRTHPVSMDCEGPSLEIYSFHGAVKTGTGTVRGVGIGNLLLRGTQLQKTDWVVCLAVFCGHETRAMMNAQAARYKLSKLDLELSKVVDMLFCCQLLACLVLAILSESWDDRKSTGSWYLHGTEDDSSAPLLLVSYGTSLLLTCNTVPISLIVTLTFVKFIQSIFIYWDRCLCGAKPAEVHTSQVIESLGQITHVFSDKTGTLTKNQMEYKACSVKGRIYGLTEAGTELQDSDWGGGSGVVGGGRVQLPHVDFHDKAFRQDLHDSSSRASWLASFLLVHAVCHTVTVNKNTPSEASLGEEAHYDASSPDELALVSMARALGLEFISAHEGRTRLHVRGAGLAAALEAACGWKGGDADAASGGRAGSRRPSREVSGELEIEVLDHLEFDNERKRMSVVVRYPDGKLMLLTKGADTTMLPHCGGTPEENQRCEDHLWRFASRGLRTLCLAMRTLDKDDFATWHRQWLNAKKSFEDDRLDRLQQLAIELEEAAPLQLLGATAIEDMLQDQVPETIEQFRQAGIRVWVLTGDKVETAISIAHSCQLITEDIDNRVVDGATAEEVRKALQDACDVTCPTALTITGAALALALRTDRTLLYEAAVQCCAVLCCRVSPKQKADVVSLVKAHEHAAVTLSIGDGANDVSMIVTAHVGVGIVGKEGAQAARVADFAISEFRMLRRLLFVHGRESYRRMAVLALYNFYKNIILSMPFVLTAYTTCYTGQNIFHPWLVQVHNIIYSHVAVCLYGCFDRAKLPFSKLEFVTTEWARRRFSRSAVVVWILVAVAQAILYTKMATEVLKDATSNGGLPMEDLYTLGNLRFAWVVVGVNLTMYFRHVTWFWWMALPYIFNISCLCISMALTNEERGGFAEGVHEEMFLSANLMRILTASLLTMMGHCFIAEIAIRRDANIAQAVSRWANIFCLRLGIRLTPSRVVPLIHIPQKSSGDRVPLRQEGPGRGVPAKDGDRRRSVRGFAFAEECAIQHRRESLQGSRSERYRRSLEAIPAWGLHGRSSNAGDIELSHMPTAPAAPGVPLLAPVASPKACATH